MANSSLNSKLYTISEVVSALRRQGFYVESHKLRDYEKKGLLLPERTSKEQRRYSDLDIGKIRRILIFLFIGLSLKEIKNLFDLEKEFCDVYNKGNKINLPALSLLTKRIDNFYGEIIERIINQEGILKEISSVPESPSENNLLIYQAMVNAAKETLARRA